jgi:hypothetical protein
VGSVRSIVWIGTLAAAAATYAACMLSGLVLAAGSRPLALSFALAAVLCLWRKPSSFVTHARLVAAIEGFLLFAAMGAMGAILSYVAMLQSSGFTDPLLDRWDSALGFHWPAIRAELLRHEWLSFVMEKAYLACFWMPFAVFALLYRADQIDRLYRYLRAHGMALAVTIVVFFFFPARAAFAFYLAPGTPLPGNAKHYGAVIQGLRDGSFTTIDLAHLGGIITFPSFHAAMAILFVWAVWPARRFRLPMVAVNLLMWLAAVPLGGHYVVDLLGGSVIAVAALAVAAKAGRASATSGSYPAAASEAALAA